MAHTYKFRDVDVRYDEKVLQRWPCFKALNGASGGIAYFQTVDELLCGRSDEVASALGEDRDTMMELVNELIAASPQAKN